MGAHASLLLLPGQALRVPFPASLAPAFFACCSGGLHNVIYAFGLGYGLCMVTGGLVTYAEAPPSLGSQLACGLYVAYGLRLSSFMLRRQSDAAYNNSSHGQKLQAKLMASTLSRKACITSFVTLYMLTPMVALQQLATAPQLSVLALAGLGVGAAGLVLEAVADEEKLAAKRRSPEAPVMTGTYAIVQHPNYLGEVLFWSGIASATQAALPANASILQRAGGLLGPLLMVRIMMSASKSLSKKQAGDKYGDNVEFQNYARRTRLLIPGVY